LGLVGTGIFTREVHVSSLQSLGQAFDVVAVYSRTHEAAAALASQLPGRVQPYTDLVALLARDDIEAVDITLPIQALPAAVELALQAGKHIMSEKPIAPDVATGRRLLSVYAQHPAQVWLVGENWRYEDAFEQAAGLIHSGQLGQLRLGHWIVYNPINPDNKYYATTWRRAGDFPGGFLLDVGVHHVAVLRWLVGEIAAVTAITGQQRADLPPADTLSATLQFENGVVGSYLVSYGLSAPWPPALHLTGEAGSLWVHRQGLVTTLNGETRNIPVAPHQGVARQMAAFAAAIRRSEPHRNPPQQALQDVAVIEAMLHAAKTGQSCSPAQIG
jgi:predicted dehydrogenase